MIGKYRGKQLRHDRNGGEGEEGGGQFISGVFSFLEKRWFGPEEYVAVSSRKGTEGGVGGREVSL